jgi:hypothetical protein
VNIDTGAFQALTAEVAGLEDQVADLAAEVRDLRAQAFVIRTLEEVRAGVWQPPAAPSRRPRHLHAVGSSR